MAPLFSQCPVFSISSKLSFLYNDEIENLNCFFLSLLFSSSSATGLHDGKPDLRPEM